jgi:hypothetical protein
MNYAFDEFKTLASRLPLSSSLEDPNLWYVSALVAELCYAQVPQFEIDHRRRLTIVPCEAYREILIAGTATNLVAYFEDAGFDLIFVIILQNVIAIGIQIGNRLFIGFRGTLFFSPYDWKINLRTSLYPLDSKSGRYHIGFLDEAHRVADYILREVHSLAIPATEVVLSGHSLGGAVAAICKIFLSNYWYIPPPNPDMRTIMVAAPRYCDGAAYNARRAAPYPVQLRRTGDMIPTVPPRIFGYADSPQEFNTSGDLLLKSPRALEMVYSLGRWPLFVGSGFAAHKIEKYREELGPRAGATLYSERLLNPKLLKASGQRGEKGIIMAARP